MCVICADSVLYHTITDVFQNAFVLENCACVQHKKKTPSIAWTYYDGYCCYCYGTL